MILRNLFGIRYNYEHPIDKHRANVLLSITWLFTAMWLVWMPYFVINQADWSNLTFINIVLLFGLPITLVGIATSLQTGYLRVASIIFIGFTLALTVPLVTIRLDFSLSILVFVPMIATALLFGRNGMGTMFLILLAVIMVGAISQSRLTDPVEVIRSSSVVLDFAIVVTILIMGSSFLYAFGDVASRLTTQSINTTLGLKLVAGFEQRIDPDNEYSIYTNAIEFVRDDLGYVFTQIFLIDDSGQLTRRIRATQVVRGEDLFSNVTINDASVLLESLASRRSIMINLDSQEIRREHLLPAVNFGVAVPLMYGDQALGVLDVQANTRQFKQSEIQILDALASRLSSIIINVRRIQALRQSVREQEGISENLRNQLRTIKQGGFQSGAESILGRYGQRQQAQSLGFNINSKTKEITPAGDLSDELRAIMESGNIHIEEKGKNHIIFVPIVLRGEVLGAMTFVMDSPPMDRQVEIAQNVATRLALALENARLFEQSQAQANRERKATEAANLLLTATDVDAVLKLASNSFNEALGAINTSIHLQPDIVREQTQPLPDVDGLSSTNGTSSEKEVN